jgi:hypothetical protein
MLQSPESSNMRPIKISVGYEPIRDQIGKEALLSLQEVILKPMIKHKFGGGSCASPYPSIL